MRDMENTIRQMYNCSGCDFTPFDTLKDELCSTTWSMQVCVGMP